jgi:hypothetical protein
LGFVYEEVKNRTNVTWRDAKFQFYTLETIYGKRNSFQYNVKGLCVGALDIAYGLLFEA